MGFDLKAGNRSIRREWVRVAVSHYSMFTGKYILLMMLKLGESFEVLVLGVVAAIAAIGEVVG
jgi:hypothetical protein